MSTTERCVLTLELDTTAEPLAGVILDQHGTSQPFSGWLGLASVIEIAIGQRSGEVIAQTLPARGTGHVD
jgi:hypothetical protein